ncbi:hypothetical protein EV356DRAFT_458473, partial [Viridothelium virens]
LLHQENELVKYINTLLDCGIPPTLRLTRNLAENMVKTPLGKNWLPRFIERHPNELHSLYLNTFDLTQKRADNYHCLELYFKLVSQSKLVVFRLKST